jgi:hypothetical protein
MIKIEGLDKLTRDLEALQKATEDLDGEIGAVNFDPNDPGSIEAAIQESERMIDEKLGNQGHNDVVSSIAEGMKSQIRSAIIDKAAAERLKADEEL